MTMMCAACASSADPVIQPTVRHIPPAPPVCTTRERLPVINKGDDARGQIARHRKKLVIQNDRSRHCEEWLDTVREDMARPE
jgi:hypothetical protein